MLQIGHIDPFRLAFNSLEGSLMNPTHAGSIGHMVLTGKPKELREEYIGQVDLISQNDTNSPENLRKPEFPNVSHMYRCFYDNGVEESHTD